VKAYVREVLGLITGVYPDHPGMFIDLTEFIQATAGILSQLDLSPNHYSPLA
jgi:hypothetical protein